MRSDVVVCGADCHCDALHAVYGAHTRSDVSVGAVISYSCPITQRVSAVHTRSAVGPGAADCHCDMLHRVSAAHTRFDDRVGGNTSHWELLHRVSVAHTRSDVAVGGASSYCVHVETGPLLPHALMGAHFRFDVAMP